MARETSSDVEHDYQRYNGVIARRDGVPADATADVIDDLDDIFAQEALRKVDGKSFFTIEDRSAITTVLTQLAKTVLASGPGLIDLLEVWLMKWRPPVRLL